MSRVVSLYLPTWPTDRLRRQTGDAAPPPERPLVIAQTQARVPDLHIEPADPAADAAALARLALWALRRYSPVGAIDLPDGLLIDATGVAHLFGGETALLDELHARLRPPPDDVLSSCREPCYPARPVARPPHRAYAIWLGGQRRAPQPLCRSRRGV
jgi:hypothetical protein